MKIPVKLKNRDQEDQNELNHNRQKLHPISQERVFLGYHRAQVSAKIMYQHNYTGVYNVTNNYTGVYRIQNGVWLSDRLSDANLTVNYWT